MSIFDKQCACGSKKMIYYNDTSHVTHVYKIENGEFINSQINNQTKGYRNTKLECSKCGKVIFENSLTKHF